MTVRNKWTVTQKHSTHDKEYNGLPVSTNIQLKAAVFSITEYMLIKIYVSIIDPDIWLRFGRNSIIGGNKA